MNFLALSAVILWLIQNNIFRETVESGETSQLKYSAKSKISAENLHSWSGKMAAVTCIV